jgi:hypothetical protein
MVKYLQALHQVHQEQMHEHLIEVYTYLVSGQP